MAGRAVLNIGGIANFTMIPPAGACSRPLLRHLISPCTCADAPSFSSKFVGFDTGPGNALMDLWTTRHWQRAYDDNGKLAAKGRVIEALLDRMLQHEYFLRPAPKSTGRELFSGSWLDEQLSSHRAAQHADGCTMLQDCDAEQYLLDVLATLLALTCRSIVGHLRHAQFTVAQVCALSSDNTPRVVPPVALPAADASLLQTEALCCVLFLRLHQLPGGSLRGRRAQCLSHAAASAALPLLSHVVDP